MTDRFGAKSTTDEVLAGIDLNGKLVLVTGVSAGLGVETARALAAHGATVVGAARDLAKAGSATAVIVEGLELLELDLASLASVRSAADTLLADGRSFDLIIANAGVMATPFDRTVDGFELQFGTNFLGHFVFVNRIAPLLQEGSRFISLSSSGHQIADVDVDDPDFARTPYDPWIAYGRSKTACALLAIGFDKRHRDRGVRAAAVHPGIIRTELSRHLSQAELDALIASIGEAVPEGAPPFEWKSIPQGAATTVWAGVKASAEDIAGQYCEDCHVASVTEGGFSGVRTYAISEENADKLWSKAEELVGERF